MAVDGGGGPIGRPWGQGKLEDGHTWCSLPVASTAATVTPSDGAWPRLRALEGGATPQQPREKGAKVTSGAHNYERKDASPRSNNDPSTPFNRLNLGAWRSSASSSKSTSASRPSTGPRPPHTFLTSLATKA